MKLDLPPEYIVAQLEEYRRYFEAGDKNALFQAIGFCFNQEIVAPEWIVHAFFRAMNKWYSMQVKELGEAFGLAWPKGKSVAAARKKRRLRYAVSNDIHDEKSRGGTVDDGLFEAIGKKYGLGITLVKEYYASARYVHRPCAADMLIKDEVVPQFSNPTASKSRLRRKK